MKGKPMKKKGFTFIEVMIGLAIIFILMLLAGTAMKGGLGETSFGVNGLVEARCINGFKHTVGQNGFPTQTIGENGGGIPCQ